MNMARKSLFAATALLALVFVVAAVQPASAEKGRIAVMEFTTKAGGGTHWWHDASWDIGWGMAEMLTTGLVETSKFRVLERQQIEDALGEQDFGASGRVDSGTEAKLGKVLGANMLVYGTVNEFEYNEKGTGGKIGFKGIGVGGSVTKAHIGMDVRVVDATTSEILFSKRFTKDASRKGFDVSVNKGGLGTDVGTFKNTPLGEATREAINEAALAIAEKLGEGGAAAPVAAAFTSPLVVADDGSLVIEAGTKQGLKQGDVMEVYKAKTVTAGGKTMTVGEELVGKVKLTMVGDAASVATATEGSKFGKGCTVKLVR